MLLSVVAGLALGVGAAFVVEQFDDRVRTPEDVERTLGVPVLGIVPVFGGKRDA
jgi:capsular polysaccharide biosynthesis protein